MSDIRKNSIATYRAFADMVPRAGDGAMVQTMQRHGGSNRQRPEPRTTDTDPTSGRKNVNDNWHAPNPAA